MTPESRPRLVVASHNPDKVAALRAVVGGAAVRPAPRDISLESEESDASLLANAEEKARRVSRQMPGVLVVATDGGLEIPALGAAWNPVLTRRFAGKDATNAARVHLLLKQTCHLRGSERTIAWREAMAVARDGSILASWEETGPNGLLAERMPSGAENRDGFWAPLIWRCPECGGRMLSDLPEREREARRDHWQRLGEDLRAFLAALDDDTGT